MSRWGDRTDRTAYPGPGLDLPVFYNDLDPNGHLNNVALGRFFEQARVGGRQREMLDAVRPGRFVVARVAIDYLVEGRWGTPLHVRSRLARIGTSSFTWEQAAWQGEGCLGLAEVVLVHLQGDRPAPLPAAFRESAAS